MPTRVTRHISHSRTGKREVVRTYVRMGPEHTARWKRLVKDVQRANRERGTKYNPYAVATATFGAASFPKRRSR